ncbi:hypothetical protein, partial [Acetobacter senegalensis]|uniref:hypothetical protein n=1 Tax=Acetobacter senegalensis TaxID=446692 RepID=UPI001EDB5E75
LCPEHFRLGAFEVALAGQLWYRHPMGWLARKWSGRCEGIGQAVICEIEVEQGRPFTAQRCD